MASWYFEGVAADGNVLLIPITHLPFRVGRDPQCELAVTSSDLSRNHARIEADGGGGLRVVDLGSTNGTFVNRQRIQEAMAIKEGDILHFGTSEFRLKYKASPRAAQGKTERQSTATIMVDKEAALPENFLLEEKEFLEMLDLGNLKVAWQPIVHVHDLSLAAFEVLGRGGHPSLPASPIRLLSLAKALRKEVELSEAFRAAGARAAARRGGKVRLFMNSHPKEMFTEAFYQSIDRLRDIAPDMELVMEVHETAVAEVENMKVMAKRLRDLGVMLAYDDFGAGQSRLNELAEVPPDVVKFDMGLIHDIDLASDKKQNMLASLVNIVLKIGSTALAEGVETQGEADVCRQMGFQLYQGYLFGKPALVESRPMSIGA